LLVTVYVAVAAQLLGMMLGLVFAMGRRSRWLFVRAVSLAYVTYIRGTPLLVQLTLVYFGIAQLNLIHFADWHVLGLVIPGVAQAGVLALGINKGAYVAEIFRAAIESVEASQWDAGLALGLRRMAVYRHIVFPQAIRIALPALGNEFNAVLKDTSLLVIIGGVELFHAFQVLNGQLFQPFELYLAMSFYFLALTCAWGVAQSLLERRLGRGFPTMRHPRPRLGRLLWKAS
jgi:polar amino acid transport system permease protein